MGTVFLRSPRVKPRLPVVHGEQVFSQLHGRIVQFVRWEANAAVVLDPASGIQLPEKVHVSQLQTRWGTSREACIVLRCSPRTLWRYVALGKISGPIHLSAKHVLWDLHRLRDWLDEQATASAVPTPG